jgi:hypothetical protein
MMEAMIHDFQAGDYIIFQLESGYGLLRVLDVVGSTDSPVWHVRVYKEFFLDPEMADAALDDPGSLSVELPHVALTNRAFESTQVAKMRNVMLTDAERLGVDVDCDPSDRSIRLMLGLR